MIDATIDAMTTASSQALPVLAATDIHAHYDDLQVLFGVSIEVREKEVVTIVGANGAGKTTTINAISGMGVRCTGKIEFCGADIGQMPAHGRAQAGLVHVPEGRKLFPFMTVQENIELGAYSTRARADRKATMEEVLTLLPRLKERLKQLAGTLSGGEQQMVAIGRGLIAKPRLLMLDEPTLGLAPKMVALVFETVDAIRSRGIPILLVEQNVKHCLNIADRAYVLENGRVVLEGPGKVLLADERLKAAY
ncbi:MAG: transporter ATP-binding protein, partial [Paucimonas sp.]|nr:transporter ATP-binding protein [Paucimonas sp.]